MPAGASSASPSVSAHVNLQPQPSQHARTVPRASQLTPDERRGTDLLPILENTAALDRKALDGIRHHSSRMMKALNVKMTNASTAKGKIIPALKIEGLKSKPHVHTVVDVAMSMSSSSAKVRSGGRRGGSEQLVTYTIKGFADTNRNGLLRPLFVEFFNDLLMNGLIKALDATDADMLLVTKRADPTRGIWFLTAAEEEARIASAIAGERDYYIKRMREILEEESVVEAATRNVVETMSEMEQLVHADIMRRVDDVDADGSIQLSSEVASLLARLVAASGCCICCIWLHLVASGCCI